MKTYFYWATVVATMFVSPPARANCPDTARATIVFGNGIETTRRDAQASLQSVLEPAISQELGTTVDQSCIAYYLAYDSQFVDLNNKVSSTINFFSQLVDAAVQRDIDFAANFWQYWRLGVQPPDWFQNIQRDVITSVTSVFQPDLLTHELFYSAELALGHKLIVVAHSQGNLYVNQAYSVVTITGGSDLFHIVGVATPAPSVAGSGPYFTLHGDIITIVPGSLSANITNDPPSPCPTVLFNVACHNFDSSYMDLQNGDKTRPAIVNAVVALIRPVSQVSFSRSDLLRTNQPIQVGLADLNRDNKLDLLVAEPYGSTISVLLGNGNGTFQGLSDLNFPGSTVAVADFNGDGIPDIAVASFFFFGQIQIFLGNGDGTFTEGSRLQTGGGLPTWISVADFDGDGRLDLALASEFPDHIAVFLGDGTGNFNQSANFVPGAAPQEIAVADFNGDGRLDLAVANANSSNVTLWFGMGGGAFQAGGNFSTPVGCWSVVVADFNGDGKMDLAFPVASVGVYIFLGNGDGTFGLKQLVQIPLAGSTLRVVTSDFDRDGKLDLAVSDSFFNNVTILLGKGDGTFGDGLSIPVGAAPFSLAVGDLNNDGRPDLVTGNIGLPNTVSVLLNTSH